MDGACGWCPAPGKDEDDDIKVVLNVAGLDREKTENTNRKKEKIMTNSYPIEYAR